MNKNNNSTLIAKYLREEIKDKEVLLSTKLDIYYKTKKDIELQKSIVGLTYITFKDKTIAESSDLYKKAIKKQFSLDKSLSLLKVEQEVLLHEVINLKSALTWYEDDIDEFDD